MPFVNKSRKFKSSSNKGGVRKLSTGTSLKFRRSLATKAAFSSFDGASSSTSVTKLNFPQSKMYRSPIPDRYFCWVSANQEGTLAAGGQTSFNFALNIALRPFNNVGGGNVISNAVPSATSNGLYGFNNLLFNATTNTGLWINYRVWTVIVKVEANTQLTTLNNDHAMAPVIGTSVYSTFNNLCLGPHSVQKGIGSGFSVNESALRKTYSIPEILGVSKEEYGALSNQTYGSGASLPNTNVYLQYMLKQASVTSDTNMVVRVQYHIEFFQNGLVTMLAN